MNTPFNYIYNSDPKTWQEYRNLAKYICNCWNNDYGSATLHRNTLRLATGGWSENETIQSALDANIKMKLYWYMSKTGGLTIYKLPTKKAFKPFK